MGIKCINMYKGLEQCLALSKTLINDYHSHCDMSRIK